MRAANAIDFWRGTALVSIFINHIPGFTFERWTPRNFGLSDSAELFVFLAGWALRLVVSRGAAEPLGLPRLVLRLAARAVTLYAAQILITAVAIAMTAFASMALDNPLLLEWNNAAAVFQDPVQTHLGLVLLSHQLGFFDILPLYVLLMMAAPAIAVTHRLSPILVLPISMTIYIVALSLQLNIPTWPIEGVWFFNPFAWQFIFVLGFSLAGGAPNRFGRRVIPWIRPLAWLVLAAAATAVLRGFEPDPMRVPQPTLFFIWDKSYLSPARVIHFLALVVTFAGGFRYVARFVPPVARYGSMLGRNSLNVFCVGSVLSLAGQFVRVALGGGFGVDCGVVLVGIAALGFTAWVSELRDRLRGSAAPSPSPASSAA